MFTLINYEREIREGAAKAKTDNEEALNRFIYNLVVMRPHFEDFPNTVNFRTLGQQWNGLPSDTRNEQKNNMRVILSKATRTRVMHE